MLLSVVSNGYRFDGSGYVVLDTVQTGWKPAITAQVSLGFKTYAENGLLFYAGKGRDFLSIELRNGRLLHQFDLGGGRVQLNAAKKVNDGEWHYVQVNRVNKTGVMYVDQEYCKYDLYSCKSNFKERFQIEEKDVPHCWICMTDPFCYNAILGCGFLVHLCHTVTDIQLYDWVPHDFMKILLPTIKFVLKVLRHMNLTSDIHFKFAFAKTVFKLNHFKLLCNMYVFTNICKSDHPIALLQ